MRKVDTLCLDGCYCQVSFSGLTCKWKYLLPDVFLTVFGRRVGSTWVYQQVSQQSTLPPLSSRDVSLPFPGHYLKRLQCGVSLKTSMHYFLRCEFWLHLSSEGYRN